jgi:FAD/FMN-containing dehydrogenase
LISTSELNGIELLPDNVVKFGSGLNWAPVYEFLTKYGLIVPGGRAGPVGVSGYLLHGGVSFFPNVLGWGCASILEFEVVLASGEIVTANSEQNPDLYWALKGGGNNFGVVASYSMQAQYLPQIWGGSRVIVGNESNIALAMNALRKLQDNESIDPNGSVEVITSWGQGANTTDDPIVVALLAYAKPAPFPGSLAPFTDIPFVASTLRTTTVMNLTQDDGSFADLGYR